MSIFKYVLPLILFPQLVQADNGSFARYLCKEYPEKYRCEVTKFKGYKTWQELFPKDYEELIRINRRNTYIWNNHTIAFKKRRDFREINLPNILPKNNKIILIDLNDLSWGAYEKGKLVDWGPANGGRGICPETGKKDCYSPIGVYRIESRKGYRARSSLYPIECTNKKKCGFHMPYMMKFENRPEGLHGAKWLTGENKSHGCIRLLPEDAKWLNINFVEIGTEVQILPYK